MTFLKQPKPLKITKRWVEKEFKYLYEFLEDTNPSHTDPYNPKELGVACSLHSKEVGWKITERNQICKKPTNWKTTDSSPFLHAEAAAVLKCVECHIKEFTVAVVTHSPCPYCLKLLIYLGITEIYFSNEREDYFKSKELADLYEVRLKQISNPPEKS